MTYVIKAKVHNFSYYIKIHGQNAEYPIHHTYEGLVDNASEFPSEASALQIMNQISSINQLSVIQKPKRKGK